MNYILQILGIRKTERQRGEPLSLAAFRLHHTLLAISNSRGWPNPVFISSAEIFAESRLAENTVARARRELAAAGLIQYTTSKGRGHAAAYYIKPFAKEDFNTEKSAAFEDFNGEKSLNKSAAFEDQTKHINRSFVNKSGRQAENPNNLGIFEGPQPERETPGKEKETAPEGAAPENARKGPILADVDPGGTTPQPNPQTPLSANSGENNYQGTGPTLAQVEAEQRAKGYQLEAARFYSHFAPDWKTANGEPVRSWRKLYAWCEKNGLFDAAPQKAQGPQQLPPRDATEYEDRLPPECYETQPAPETGNGERLDLAALERELLGGSNQPRNSRYL